MTAKTKTLIVRFTDENSEVREWYEYMNGRSIEESLKDAREDMKRVYPFSTEISWEVKK